MLPRTEVDLVHMSEVTYSVVAAVMDEQAHEVEIHWQIPRRALQQQHHLLPNGVHLHWQIAC